MFKTINQIYDIYIYKICVRAMQGDSYPQYWLENPPERVRWIFPATESAIATFDCQRVNGILLGY